jgi:hypothetical protein
MPLKDTAAKREYQQNYRATHKEQIKKQRAGHYQENKESIARDHATYYDNNNIKALSIDHINGGGGKHRKESNITHFYNWLKKNNYPTGFQTLCLNCQFIKRYDAKEQYKKK